MHLSDNALIVSATDLSGFLACAHLPALNWERVHGHRPAPPVYDDPGTEVLKQRGLEHELRYLESLRNAGLGITEIARSDEGGSRAESWRSRSAATRAAMQDGVDVIYQGVLFDGRWLGLPDFLRRVERPSALGPWSYEVVDAKLAREAKAGAVLQVCLYSALLGEAQGTEPESMHLALGRPDGGVESFRFAEFAAYFRVVRDRFEESLNATRTEAARVPDPVEHCQVCSWRPICDKARRDVDHLSLVAGISRRQRASLVERGVETLSGLAQLPLTLEPPLEGTSRSAYSRIREQARVQFEGRASGEPLYELTEFQPSHGLAALPEPSDGDIFFDFEGDGYALDEGLEYLFGWVDVDEAYSGEWALSRAEEKRQFERFVDFVFDRRQSHPDLHVYHYAPYEPTALKRLACRHGVKEEEVDELLRSETFVDLYRVVRQGIRAAVESYSIKKLEPIYGFEREEQLRSASAALKNFEAWLQLGGGGDVDRTMLEQIERYNRDDCVSTLRLRDWLEERRSDLERRLDEPLPRPQAPERTPVEREVEARGRTDVARTALLAGVPDDPADRTEVEQARWLLAQLLGWHRREAKSVWWDYYRMLELTVDECIEDRWAMGGLEYQGIVGTVKRSHDHRYSFPRQEFGFRRGDDTRDPATERSAGSVVALDELSRTLDLRRGTTSTVPHPLALVPFDFVPDTGQRDSLLRFADSVIESGLESDARFLGASGLLLAKAPHSQGNASAGLVLSGETPLEAARRIGLTLDHEVLPIQGPPGTGKTYTGAHMITDLLKAGKRVGITALSHKVIGNLLDKTCAVANELGVSIYGMQRASARQRCASPQIETGSNADVENGLRDGSLNLAAGTAWLWSRAEMIESVDVLFIDEAGQFSLANALAVAPAGKSLVLLGDPRQLEQPQRGVHPPGADASALDHLLRGAPTVPTNRGLFLDETWRMHPSICDLGSELYYQGRLRSRPELASQRLSGDSSIDGSGLRLVPVPHTGNRNESLEEISVVRSLVEALVERGTWTDAAGDDHEISLDDILIVAPYNAQVIALRESLPEGTHVGTVDKFQGQEAPVVIYSTASSSADEAPRGMDFLYNSNRLNVATSRARCLALVVASPDLFAPECRSVKQMALANGFCRFAELAVTSHP